MFLAFAVLCLDGLARKTNLVSVITCISIDDPKAISNRCVIQHFGVFYVFTLRVLIFFEIEVFVIGPSQNSSYSHN